MIKPYKSINTFSRRPVPAQIVTYFVFIGEMLTFFICMYINFRNTPTQIAILVCYLFTVFVQLIITIRVSCIDPSDDIMITYRTDPQNRQNININECLYCDICISYVKQTSRHCKVCQRYCIELSFVGKQLIYARCVEEFDHHCMWVNNCIGSKNYKEFMAMILVTLLNMIVYVVGMILLWTEDHWREFMGPMIALWAFSLVSVIFTILLINLVALHLYLISKGITTYQFIMLQREQARRKKEQEEKRKQVQLTENRHQTVVPVSKKPAQQSSYGQNTKQLVQTSNQQFPTQNNFKSPQNSDVIFGNNPHDLSHESKTQKSINEPSTKQKKPKDNNIKISIQQNDRIEGQQDEDYDEQPSPLNSKKEESEVNVSRFFIKNKSIKFFIGDEIGSRPKSTIRGKKSLGDNNMYHSVKVNRKETKNNKSMYVSQVKGNNDFPESKSSISLKAIKPKN